MVSNDCVRPTRAIATGDTVLRHRSHYVKGRPSAGCSIATSRRAGLGEHKCGTPIDVPKPGYLPPARPEVAVLLHMDTGATPMSRDCRVQHFSCPPSAIDGPAGGRRSGGQRQEKLGGYPPGRSSRRRGRPVDGKHRTWRSKAAANAISATGLRPRFSSAGLTGCCSAPTTAEGQQVGQFEFLDRLDLPADVQAKIFRDNARRILNR